MSTRSRKLVKSAVAVPAGYEPLLTELKERVRAAQLRAATSVARELNQLYWEIGSAIARAQASKGYSKQVVEQLAVDLQTEFPGMAAKQLRGASPSVEDLEQGLAGDKP